jgi:hypothetical protein
MNCSGSAYQGEQQNRTATCSGDSRVRRESGDRPAAAVCRGRAGIRTAASVCSSQGLACISPAQRESGAGGGGGWLAAAASSVGELLGMFFSCVAQQSAAVWWCSQRLPSSTCGQHLCPRVQVNSSCVCSDLVVFRPHKFVVAAIEGRTAPPLPILRYIYRDTDWKDHQRVQHMHMQLANSSVQLLISAFGCCNRRLAAPQLALSSLWCHLLLERPQPHRTPTMWCWSPVSPVSFLPPSMNLVPGFIFVVPGCIFCVL